jgi:RNase P/RNase MRP subunit POP5
MTTTTTASRFTNVAPFSTASHWFLLIRVHSSPPLFVSVAAVQQIVRTSLRDACGELALSTWPVDVLMHDATKSCAVLRCAAEHVIGLRAALTLHTANRIDVVQAEPTLALIQLSSLDTQ